MALYSKQTWVDRSVQYPRRFTDQNNNVLTLTPSPGTITAAGTAVDATRMNHLEDGVDGAYDLMTMSRIKMRNVLTNSRFDSTTGWTASGSALTASGNVLSVTGNGALSNANAIQTTSNALASGKKYYVRAKIRVTNANCTSIAVHAYDGSSSYIAAFASQLNPAANTWYDLSGIVTIGAQTGNLKLYIRHYYADAATANGKVMEVKYVTLIDLTTDYGSTLEPTQTEQDNYMLTLPNYHFSGSNNIINGIWTPDLQFGGAKVGITYSTQSGEYTQVGDIVTATGIIILTSKGSSAGDATIAGLPLPIGHYSAAALRCEAMAAGATGFIQGLLAPGSSYIRLEKFAAGAYGILTNAEFDNASILIISASYHV